MNFGFDDNADDWVCVKTARSSRAMSEFELVLTAIGIEFRTSRTLLGWQLFTHVVTAETAKRQLDLYTKENAVVYRKSITIVTIDNGLKGVVGYLAVIWSVWFADVSGISTPGISMGVLHAGSVVAGEWWLTITALTLHADFGHIASNSLFGGVFGLIAGRYYGSGLAWLLILLSGAFGNYINSAVQDDAFRALGASTAAFAAAGLISGHSWRRTYIQGAGFRLNFLPIAGAIGIFIFAGISGDNVDIVGHLMGLVVGIAVGMGIANIDFRRLGNSGQFLAGIFAMLLVIYAWIQVL